MKKIIIFLVVCTSLLGGCGKGEEVIEIGEKMFIEQMNDIYYNFDEYDGKKIRYEGIFYAYPDSEQFPAYQAVIRRGPGCCGDDGEVGFEVKWDKEYPAQDEWVEVIGVLSKDEESGYQRIQVELTSLEVLTTRGEEFVTQ